MNSLSIEITVRWGLWEAEVPILTSGMMKHLLEKWLWSIPGSGLVEVYPFCSSDTYKRSQKEWLLDPDLTKLGLRCLFGGVHKASATSDSDFIRTMLFGHRRHGKKKTFCFCCSLSLDFLFSGGHSFQCSTIKWWEIYAFKNKMEK